MEKNELHLFKGFKQIKGFGDDFSEENLQNGYVYFIRPSESKNEGYLFFNGKKYGALNYSLSNFVTFDEFETVQNSALNSIAQGSLGTINGQSIEEGDINIDMTIYKIVGELPTENILDSKIYLVKSSSSSEGKDVFNEYIYLTKEKQWDLIGQITSSIDLSEYLKKSVADNTYVKKSTNTNSNVLTDKNGAMSNFSDNGQAYLAVRPKTERFLINIPYAGASFGVKDDGTSAFSHKQYTTYNKDTGAYTGAKNTAVLQFSGPTGLRYAQNPTNGGNDVTNDMYRYVGVIDSPDDRQKVYSASKIDELLAGYTEEINKLKQAIVDLGGTI